MTRGTVTSTVAIAILAPIPISCSAATAIAIPLFPIPISLALFSPPSFISLVSFPFPLFIKLPLLLANALTLNPSLFVTFPSSSSVLLVLLALDFALFPVFLGFNLFLLFVNLPLFAHSLLMNFFALVPFGFHDGRKLLVSLVPISLLLRSDCLASLLATAFSNRAQDKLDMFRCQCFDRLFYRFVDIVAVRRSFDESRCLAPFSREKFRFSIDFRICQLD